MFPLVENWLQSGMTQQAFSQQHHLPTHVFCYWVGRYRKQKAKITTAQSPPAPSASFIRLASSTQELAPTDKPAIDMQIELPSGVVMHFASLIPVAYLKEVLSVCSR